MCVVSPNGRTFLAGVSATEHSRVPPDSSFPQASAREGVTEEESVPAWIAATDSRLVTQALVARLGPGNGVVSSAESTAARRGADRRVAPGGVQPTASAGATIRTDVARALPQPLQPVGVARDRRLPRGGAVTAGPLGHVERLVRPPEQRIGPVVRAEPRADADAGVTQSEPVTSCSAARTAWRWPWPPPGRSRAATARLVPPSRPTTSVPRLPAGGRWPGASGRGPHSGGRWRHSAS